MNRHFDRRWRQLQLRLRKPQEAQARDITAQLLLLATAQLLLTEREPPLADAWCRHYLDARGPSLINRNGQRAFTAARYRRLKPLGHRAPLRRTTGRA